jgi:tetratricopeptide (TPR) repeat protein
MRTLYDLLDALPEDDAESLRAAFRKAAKANHPDNNPGDADASLRFRRIVRANAILSDERQRATYDRLLVIALGERRLKLAIAGAVCSVALLGAYLLFGYVSRTSLIPAQAVEISGREPATPVSAMSTEPSDTVGRVHPRDERDGIASLDKPDTAEAVKEAVAPSAAAPADNANSASATAGVLAARDFGVNDAKYYREKGILAYRSGDLYLALVDLDLAIDLNPQFSDAYIDRSVVFYRMGEFGRAFADIDQAKRLDKLNGDQASLPASQPTSPPSGKD